VKKIYLFLIFFLLTGCQFNVNSKSKLASITCPSILFASEHNIYIDTVAENITLDNISYKAEINNAVFTQECFIDNNIFSSQLSILFLANPVDEAEKNITLPYYVAVLDINNNILDIQYFLKKDKFTINIDTKEFIETEIQDTILIKFKLVNQSFKIILGFVLDEERVEIIN